MESICILNDFIPMITKWEAEPTALILEEDIRRIKKLKGFVKYDREKLEKTINEFITEL